MMEFKLDMHISIHSLQYKISIMLKPSIVDSFYVSPENEILLQSPQIFLLILKSRLSIKTVAKIQINTNILLKITPCLIMLKNENFKLP